MSVYIDTRSMSPTRCNAIDSALHKRYGVRVQRVQWDLDNVSKGLLIYGNHYNTVTVAKFTERGCFTRIQDVRWDEPNYLDIINLPL